MSGANGAWTTTYETRDVLGFQAARMVIQSLMERRFSVNAESSVTITRHIHDKNEIRYGARLRLCFQRGRLGLVVIVDLESVVGSADDLIMQKGLRQSGFFVSPNPIVMGQGQKKAIEGRARELLDLGQDVLYIVEPVGSDRPCIHVQYVTRLGKGGRLVGKIATRSFSLNDAARIARIPSALMIWREAHANSEAGNGDKW